MDDDCSSIKVESDIVNVMIGQQVLLHGAFDLGTLGDYRLLTAD